MNTPDGVPWDIRKLKISLGGPADSNGWIEAEIFDNDEFSLRFRGVDFKSDDDGMVLESMSSDIARRLRDFLNYALKP